MPNVFELEASLGIDSSKFKEGIKEAIGEAEKLRKELEKTANEATDLGKEVDKEGKEADESSKDNKKLGQEVKTAGDHAEKSSGKFKELAGSIKDGLATAAKVGAGAVAAAGAGVGAIVKQAVGAYSEYEQLVGGVDKLFGEASAKVQENAEKAYANAGMSANEYLQQVTGFAASLIQATGRGEQTDIDELKETLDAEYTATKQSLADQYDAVKEHWNDRIKASKAAKDGEADALTKQRDEELKALKRSNEEQLNQLKAHNKEVIAETEKANTASVSTIESLSEAADLADVAMRSISDNVNTFGSDMASVQNAFQGFAKQNYTMLDNLRLGYGGTKEEMERLIDDANAYAESIGEASDLSITSFGDIVKAIDLIQRKQGIANTTIDEAGKTIAGSMGAVKAAYKDLIVELAKPEGDIEKAFEKLGGTAETMIQNMWPKIENALGGVGNLVTKAAPKITEAFKVAIPKILPSVISTASSLVGSVGSAVLQSLPDLLDAGKDILATLADSISNANFNGEGVIGKILESITENSGAYFDYAEKILAGIGNAIINADHAKLGRSLSTIIIKGLNSITDLLADLDMNKVGRNIADFINAIDWKAIAQSVIDLLGAALGSLGNIAGGFFENINGDQFINALMVLAAPKMLTSLLTAFKGPECVAKFGSLKDFLGAEIGSGGGAAGLSWAKAFEAAVIAFVAGWKVGTVIRESLEEKEIENINKEDQIKDDYGMYTTADGNQGIKYDVNSKTGFSEAFLNSAERGNVVYDSIAEKVQAMQGLKNRDKDVSDFYFSPFMPEYQFKAEDQTETIKQFIEDIEGPKKKPTQTQNVSYGTPNEVLYRNLPRYGDGGRVTSPTIALVGENEPETIIPDSKMNTGNVYIDKIELRIDGSFDFTNPEDRRKIIEEFSAELRMLSIKEQRAMGGAGWA